VILMGACLVLTAPLEIFGAGVYRQLRRTAAAILPVAAFFVVWDLLAILGDVWSYNPDYVTGFHIGVIPIEELSFFIVIPLCGLLTYSAVSTILAWVARRRSEQKVNR
jgi:lycopene cyclase domain-containing protein